MSSNLFFLHPLGIGALYFLLVVLVSVSRWQTERIPRRTAPEKISRRRPENPDQKSSLLSVLVFTERGSTSASPSSSSVGGGGDLHDSDFRNFRNGALTRDPIADIAARGIDIVVPWLNTSDPVWRAAAFEQQARCGYEGAGGDKDSGVLPSLCVSANATQCGRAP